MPGEKPRKFDVSSYPKPDGVLDITWTHLEMRPKYIREYPFEMGVMAVPCSGNSMRGNEQNHAYYIELITPIWTEGDENGLGYGLWQFEDQRLAGWMSKEKLPATYNVEGIEFEVKIGSSHDLCPKCRF